MKQFIAILISLVVASEAANSGYRYQQPQRQQQQPIPIRPSPQYSLPAPAPQLPPPSPAISLPPPPPPAPAPPPAPVQPQQQYLPPQQHQQVFVQQQHQQVFSQPQQQVFSQPQQQVFSQPQQQVFSQPQPVQQFSQVSHGQAQLSEPIQQSFQRPQQTIITKDIYIHSAPEDNDVDAGLGPQYDAGPVRKNYRIVFIKAPTQNLRHTAAALQSAQSHNEEKTIIYVLSKKPDLSEVQQQLQQSQGEHKASKPEVYFIKYKTQEEAQRAQQEIQAQYDALGGSTHISDEGVAPITNVGSGALNFGGPISGGFQPSGNVGLEYLPPRAVKK